MICFEEKEVKEMTVASTSQPSSTGSSSSGSGGSGDTVPTTPTSEYLALTNAIGSSGLVLLGGHWLFLPDTPTSTLQSRLAITSTLPLLGHYLAPADTLSAISTEASAIAFVTGSMMSVGFTMILHKHEKHRWKFIQRCLGGSLLNFGGFLWVPSVVRQGWQFNHSYLTADITTSGIVLNTCKGILLGILWDVIGNLVSKSVEVGVNLVDHLQDHPEGADIVKKAHEDSAVDESKSMISKVSSALCRPVGGGLFMLGMYLWLPPAARGYFDVSTRIRRILKLINYISTFINK